jgi:hypothetical protein
VTETVTLFRPVGPEELALVELSGHRSFPQRLEGQPIFYPVLNREYAEKIAREWNVKESGAGFVTEFDVRADFLSEFVTQTVGDRTCQEYWIPAERLDEFNRAIVGTIRVVARFGGQDT